MKKNLKLFLIFFSDVAVDSLSKPPVFFEVSQVTVVSDTSFITKILLASYLRSTSRLRGRFASLKFSTSSDDHKDGGNKEQRSPGGENQASNYCSTQWSVLLTAFTQAQCHRNHSDDHRQRRHEHRPDTGIASLERCAVGVMIMFELLIGEGDDQNAVRRGYSHT